MNCSATIDCKHCGMPVLSVKDREQCIKELEEAIRELKDKLAQSREEKYAAWADRLKSYQD